MEPRLRGEAQDGAFLRPLRLMSVSVEEMAGQEGRVPTGMKAALAAL